LSARELYGIQSTQRLTLDKMFCEIKHRSVNRNKNIFFPYVVQKIISRRAASAIFSVFSRVLR
jgi:hypothetical protein